MALGQGLALSTSSRGEGGGACLELDTEHCGVLSSVGFPFFPSHPHLRFLNKFNHLRVILKAKSTLGALTPGWSFKGLCTGRLSLLLQATLSLSPCFLPGFWSQEGQMAQIVETVAQLGLGMHLACPECPREFSIQDADVQKAPVCRLSLRNARL